MYPTLESIGELYVTSKKLWNMSIFNLFDDTEILSMYLHLNITLLYFLPFDSNLKLSTFLYFTLESHKDASLHLHTFEYFLSTCHIVIYYFVFPNLLQFRLCIFHPTQYVKMWLSTLCFCLQHWLFINLLQKGFDLCFIQISYCFQKSAQKK